MDVMLNVKDFTMIIGFAITLGGIVWKSSSSNATFREQIKSIFSRLDEKDRKDAAQDQAIDKIDGKATTIDKNLAVVVSESRHIVSALNRIEAKIEENMNCHDKM